MADWDTLGVRYEVLTPDEIRYRWPVIGSLRGRRRWAV